MPPEEPCFVPTLLEVGTSQGKRGSSAPNGGEGVRQAARIHAGTREVEPSRTRVHFGAAATSHNARHYAQGDSLEDSLTHVAAFQRGPH